MIKIKYIAFITFLIFISSCDLETSNDRMFRCVNKSLNEVLEVRSNIRCISSTLKQNEYTEIFELLDGENMIYIKLIDYGGIQDKAGEILEFGFSVYNKSSTLLMTVLNNGVSISNESIANIDSILR